MAFGRIAKELGIRFELVVWLELE